MGLGVWGQGQGWGEGEDEGEGEGERARTQATGRVWVWCGFGVGLVGEGYTEGWGAGSKLVGVGIGIGCPTGRRVSTGLSRGGGRTIGPEHKAGDAAPRPRRVIDHAPPGLSPQPRRAALAAGGVALERVHVGGGGGGVGEGQRHERRAVVRRVVLLQEGLHARRGVRVVGEVHEDGARGGRRVPQVTEEHLCAKGGLTDEGLRAEGLRAEGLRAEG